jgi:hypothetical protein
MYVFRAWPTLPHSQNFVYFYIFLSPQKYLTRINHQFCTHSSETWNVSRLVFALTSHVLLFLKFCITKFDIFQTVHLRIFLVGKHLDAQFLLWYFYLNPLHVSNNYVLILRRTIALMPDIVLIQLSSWGWEHSCSKHVEDSNKRIIEEIVRQLVWLFNVCFFILYLFHPPYSSAFNQHGNRGLTAKS